MGGGEGVREFAPAKINLALHVLGRRADGYHLLDSLVTFADIGDEVTVELARLTTLQVTGPMAGSVESGESNLVLKAARALTRAADRDDLAATLRLDKRLPVASGIGGGSSDAAATLRALNRLWELKFDADQLMRIGASLGADVPVCVHAGSARMRGVGEIVEPTRLPQTHLVLVNPGLQVSTAAVFGRLERCDYHGLDPLPAWTSVGELAVWLGYSRNDLEPAAIALAPIIGLVLEALRGCGNCLLARMSGSGATCFGLFPDSEAAQGAALRLSQVHSNWWVRSAGTRAAACQ